MLSPPEGDARGADMGLCSWLGIDLAILSAGHRWNLNFNPPRAANLLHLHPRDSQAANRPALPPGYCPGPPHFHLFANCAGGEGGNTKSKLRKQHCSSKGPAQQSSDKAVIKPDYHARQPRLDWNAAEEPESCRDCLQG